MSQKWKTLEEGIRVRYHATRKHGIKPDTYFTLRIQINGKRTEESLGWASEGMTLAKARLELARLKEAARSGTGPTTLRERKAVTEAETVARQVGLMTIGEFWDRHYYPEALRTKKSAKSEEKLFRNWIRPQIGNLPLNALKKSPYRCRSGFDSPGGTCSTDSAVCRGGHLSPLEYGFCSRICYRRKPCTKGA